MSLDLPVPGWLTEAVEREAVAAALALSAATATTDEPRTLSEAVAVAAGLRARELAQQGIPLPIQDGGSSGGLDYARQVFKAWLMKCAIACQNELLTPVVLEGVSDPGLEDNQLDAIASFLWGHRALVSEDLCQDV